MIAQMSRQSFQSQMSFDQSFGPYRISFAQDLDELHQVLRLRHQVFFGSSEDSEDLDIDPFDFDAEHLMLWDKDMDLLIGTYRMRSSASVQDFYSQGEFAMDALLRLPGIKVELGRACLHPDYRTGACMGILWQGLALGLRQMQANWVFGCSSITLADYEEHLQNICSSVYHKYLAPESMRVRPWKTLPELENLPDLKIQGDRVKLPPLLKAYLNLGAWVCGIPAWDPEFNTVDFLTLLDVERLNQSVARHFSRAQSALV